MDAQRHAEHQARSACQHVHEPPGRGEVPAGDDVLDSAVGRHACQPGGQGRDDAYRRLRVVDDGGEPAGPGHCHQAAGAQAEDAWGAQVLQGGEGGIDDDGKESRRDRRDAVSSEDHAEPHADRAEPEGGGPVRRQAALRLELVQGLESLCRLQIPQDRVLEDPIGLGAQMDVERPGGRLVDARARGCSILSRPTDGDLAHGDRHGDVMQLGAAVERQQGRGGARRAGAGADQGLAQAHGQIVSGLRVLLHARDPIVRGRLGLRRMRRRCSGVVCGA